MARKKFSSRSIVFSFFIRGDSYKYESSESFYMTHPLRVNFTSVNWINRQTWTWLIFLDWLFYFFISAFSSWIKFFLNASFWLALMVRRSSATVFLISSVFSESFRLKFSTLMLDTEFVNWSSSVFSVSHVSCTPSNACFTLFCNLLWFFRRRAYDG